MTQLLGPILTECIREFGSFEFSPLCVREVALKSLSLGILAGSIAIKLPQIIKIVKSTSVLGISESSLALELVSATCLCLYSYLSNFPFLAYGETFFIAQQCLILNLLYWFYGKVDLSYRVLGVLFLSAVITVAGIFGLKRDALYMLGCLPISLNILARLPQIALNFRTKSTGQLAFLTFFLSFAGNLARIATTIAVISDRLTLVGHGLAALLNGTIVMQILLFSRKDYKHKTL